MKIELHKDNPKELDVLRRLAVERDVPLFLVGGALRDHLAGRPVADFDFALAAGGEALPWIFAKRIGGSCFWLDQGRGQCRIVLKHGPGNILTFDFAPLCGASIEEDLASRDFTVNAMAVDFSTTDLLIDPFSGLSDLHSRTIRCCSFSAFMDDPLRLLRAFRLAATLGFEIEDHTRSIIGDNAGLIMRVAPERIRDELFKILEVPDAEYSFTELQAAGLLSPLFPKGKDFNRGIASLGQMENILANLEEELPEHGPLLSGYLSEPLEGGVSIRSMLKLGSFLKGAGGDGTADVICNKIRLGLKSLRMLQYLLEGLEEPVVWLGSAPGIRPMYRFFKDKQSGPEAVIFAMIHYGLPDGVGRRLLSFYFTDYRDQEELLSGQEIMEAFNVAEGEEVGRAIAALRSAERTGTVATRAEALDFLQRKLLTKDLS